MSFAALLRTRDGFFFKDGRGWTTSATGRTSALDWPFPSTLRGVLRTAWGYSRERQGACLVGDGWIEATSALTLGASLPIRAAIGESLRPAHRLWPAPADALFDNGQTSVVRLDPRETSICTLGRDDDEARESLWRARPDIKGKPEKQPRWWRDIDFVQWLRCDQVEKPGPGSMALLAPARRTDVHVSINPGTSTAVDGALYSIDVVETLSKNGDEWSVALQWDVPGAPETAAFVGPLTLGGDRRLGWLETAPASLFEAPDELLRAARAGDVFGLRIVLVTPGHFARSGWLLPEFDVDSTGDTSHYVGALPGVDGTLVLRAALVQRPIHVSGWDMARNVPKSPRRLVPPGSVYFVTKLSSQPFSETEVKRLWLAALGDDTDDGYGRIVAGLWRPQAGSASH